MASDSFKFWDGFWDGLGVLTTEQRGQWITAVCEYVFDEVEPEIQDPAVNVSYLMVRKQLLESKELAKRGRENGQKGSQKGSKSNPSRGRKATPKATPKTNRREANGNEASLPTEATQSAPSSPAAEGGGSSSPVEMKTFTEMKSRTEGDFA